MEPAEATGQGGVAGEPQPGRRAAARQELSREIARLRWPQQPHSTPRMQHKQVPIAADECRRRGGQRKLKILVVLRVPAIRDALGGFEPGRSWNEQVKQIVPQRGIDEAGQPGPVQHLDNLVENGHGHGKPILHARLLDSTPWHAVGANGGSHKRRRIEDDQSSGLPGARRSAL